MVALLAAAAVAPWSHPLAFRPVAGWRAGASGTVASRYGAGRESAAWLARGVRYRDPATADPPNRTLATLPRRAIVVWAVAFEGTARERRPIVLDLRRARRLPCCESTRVAGGMEELHGLGRRRAYTVYVRVYFGSRPTAATRAAAQRALGRLDLS